MILEAKVASWRNCPESRRVVLLENARSISYFSLVKFRVIFRTTQVPKIFLGLILLRVVIAAHSQT